MSAGEPTGDPLASLGGATVPAARTAPQFQLQLATWAADGNPDTLAARLTLRRQLRSLLNNGPLKLSYCFLYVVYSDDLEQDGWYVPDQGPLTDMTAPVGLATGLWQLQQPWYLAGRQRTHREAREVWLHDLRTGLYARDALGWILSTDFSALPVLSLSVLPNGATSVVQSATGGSVGLTALPAGRDGGTCLLCSGLTDLSTVSFERPESALNLSDVVVYDRRGQITAPAGGPDTGWEEVYGPDYPWNWMTAGQANDTPVLDNGLVRVRYDGSNTPGFRVDVWTGSAYVEQGKMTVFRNGDSGGYCNTWTSASLVEWTPDRAVMMVVLANSADTFSRERVYVTLQRGELGVTFEVYPALKSAGGQADAVLQWTPALNSGAADLNNSVAKIDSQGSGSWTPGAAGTAVYAATAGTGAGTGNSGQFGALATLGAANFTSSENWAAVLRCPTVYNTVGPYQHTLVVLQAAGAIAKYAGSSATAYGTGQDTYQVSSQNAAGYVQCQVFFSATQAQQVMEAEAMTLGTGTSSTADASASGGTAATATRTTDANAHVTQANWPNGQAGQYRVFVRVKISGGATGSIYVKTGAQTGTTQTFTNSSYAWVDAGDLSANGVSAFELHLWVSSGSGTVSADRVEALLTVDALRTGAYRSGSRDAGQSALLDSRLLGALVSR